MKQGNVLITPILFQDTLLTGVRHVPNAQDWLEQTKNPKNIFEADGLHVTWIWFKNIFNYSFFTKHFIDSVYNRASFYLVLGISIYVLLKFVSVD